MSKLSGYEGLSGRVVEGAQWLGGRVLDSYYQQLACSMSTACYDTFFFLIICSSTG